MASNNGGAEYYNPQDIEKELDRMVAQATEAAAKGENAEQLLDIMLSTIPTKARDSLRKKFAAALKKRGLREPSGEADVPSRTTRARLMNMFTASARQALDRILVLARLRPDLATRIAQSGRILLSHGVVLDKMRFTDADLGDMAPTVVPTGKDQGTTRGV